MTRWRLIGVLFVLCVAAGAAVVVVRDGDSAAQTGGARTSVVATGLNIPWELAFLPDGRALVTERGGRVLVFRRGLRSRRSAGRVRVSHNGEGGLLGLALDPGFASNRLVYLYRTLGSENQVLRMRFSGNRLSGARVIVRGLRASSIHNGGRLAFGPDGALYITTGDSGISDPPQDPDALNGKILRLAGDAARGAGGRPEIVSLGHRNVQGLDWQPGSNRLVITELGQENQDEVNVIREGGNYGWPEVEGGDDGGGRFIPAAWDTGGENIAPSGATFVSRPGSRWTGSFLLGALGGEEVRRLTFDGDRVTRVQRLFDRSFGRIRTIVEGPGGVLYMLTSNRDGRGSPSRSDDRIIRVTPPRG